MKTPKIDIHPYTRQFYHKNIGLFLLGMLEMLLTVVMQLVVSWMLQQILDLMGGNSSLTPVQLAIVTAALIVGIVLTGLLSYYAKPKFITRGISQYKTYIFEAITRKNISAFSGENSSVYISALTNDIQAIEQGYLHSIFTLFTQVLLFAGAIALMLWYSPLLTLVAILLSLLPIIASILTGNKMAVAEARVSTRNETYTATLKDCLGGFSVIKSFRAEGQMLRIFRENVKELADAQQGKHKAKILIETLGILAAIIVQLGVFLFSAYLVLTGHNITAGTTIMFVQLMNYILNPISVIPTCLAERKAAKALVEKIAASLNSNIREEESTEHHDLENNIEIKDLSFGYEPGKQVLNNISCRFEAGKKYAIVGASGSGKSTLLNLLMASHQNYGGTICYDGTELAQISSESLYGMVSVVQQNVFVFNASIRDNITMFSDFPKEEVDRAIELSGLSQLIAQRGEDYLCGENGCGLSGGEKQRISIARSLLKKSRVLLVDEATAALDAQTAYQVSDAILNMDELTRIVVTHALDEALLKRYDHILTLKNGVIAEAGTFDELMAQQGYFYSLFTVSQ